MDGMRTSIRAGGSIHALGITNGRPPPTHTNPDRSPARSPCRLAPSPSPRTRPWRPALRLVGGGRWSVVGGVVSGGSETEHGTNHTAHVGRFGRPLSGRTKSNAPQAKSARSRVTASRGRLRLTMVCLEEGGAGLCLFLGGSGMDDEGILIECTLVGPIEEGRAGYSCRSKGFGGGLGRAEARCASKSID